VSEVTGKEVDLHPTRTGSKQNEKKIIQGIGSPKTHVTRTGKFSIESGFRKRILHTGKFHATVFCIQLQTTAVADEKKTSRSEPIVALRLQNFFLEI